MEMYTVLFEDHSSIVILENGNVVQRQTLANGTTFLTGQGAWVITDLVYKKNFGHIGTIPLCEALEKVNNKKLQFKLRNGGYRYTLMDIDHNTQRIQTNKVASIYKTPILTKEEIEKHLKGEK